MLRAAIIGISGYGRTHLQMAQEQVRRGRLRLLGAVVINPVEEAHACDELRAAGCRIFSSTGELWSVLSGQIDLCFIPTAIHWHASMTAEALAAGANVLVEKPLAGSIEEADRIIALAAARSRFVAVGFQDLYAASTETIKRRLVAGEWGRLRSIRVVAAWPRPPSYYRRNEWAGRIRVNGSWVMDSPVSNGHAHFINLALFFAGPALSQVARVTALACDRWRARAIENFDTFSLTGELEGGIRVTMHATHSCRMEIVPRITIELERGRVTWIHERQIEIEMPSRPNEIVPVDPLPVIRSRVGDAVVGHALGEPEPIVSAAAAREHVRLFSAMQVLGEIRSVPKRFITPAGRDDDAVPAIDDIEATILRASEAGLLFSEAGVAWAQVP